MNTAIITVTELQRWFEEGKKVTVLDVRPKEQRDEWKIAGSIHQDVYMQLLSGDNMALDAFDFDKNIPVVAVCTAGKTSLIATDLLVQNGYTAFSLEGGMKAWNYAWNTAEIKTKDLTVIQVRRVAKGCISYILGSQDEAIVIDAALDPAVYQQLANEKGWKIKFVMDTHIHADYISRTSDLAKATEAEFLFTEGALVDYDFTNLKDGQKIAFGTSILQAVHTAGHTPESISYLVNNAFLLTGDTLFVDGVGRPDLKATHEQGIQKAEQLFDSLGKILTLSANDLQILPAHTSASIAFDKVVIGDYLSNIVLNVDLLQLEKEDFVAQTLERIPPTPPNYIQIATLNKSGNYDGFDPAELEAGANHCAVS